MVKKICLITVGFFLMMTMTTAFAGTGEGSQGKKEMDKKGFFDNMSQHMSQKASELKESNARVKTQSLRNNKSEIERRKENKRPVKEFNPESI